MPLLVLEVASVVSLEVILYSRLASSMSFEVVGFTKKVFRGCSSYSISQRKCAKGVALIG